MAIEEKLQELELKKQQRIEYRIKHFESIFLNKDYSFLRKWNVIKPIGYTGYGYFGCPPFRASGGKLTDNFIDYICLKEYTHQVQENSIKIDLDKLALIIYKHEERENDSKYEGPNYPTYEHYEITTISNEKWDECCKILELINKYIGNYIEEQISNELKIYEEDQYNGN